MRSVRRCSPVALFALLLLNLSAFAQKGRQQFAKLGDFKLESGEVIRDCSIGYRTFGELNADKSNAVLFPTWAGGTSDDLAESIGPGRLADSSRYYIIAVDALGNGVSASPSNSHLQPRMKFPQFSIRDMVRSQHQLLTDVLHITHLKAVMGISMAGMQTFQWIVSYPGFMDKAVPIVGSPQLGAYDLVHWQAEIDAIENDPAWNRGDYAENPARAAMAEFAALFLTTPQYYSRQNTRQSALASLQQARHERSSDANDHIRQAQAMMGLDVSDAFGGSLERAAAAVTAKVLVVVARQDLTVTPGPALDFAKRIHAEVLELNAECGHQIMSCQGEKVMRAVASFLEK